MLMFSPVNTETDDDLSWYSDLRNSFNQVCGFRGFQQIVIVFFSILQVQVSIIFSLTLDFDHF
jgi:hypothetical protein